MRTIHVIGIGAGDPDYVTAQAVKALNDTQVFFAMDKGDRTRGGKGPDAQDDLVALRKLVCDRFIERPDYRFVEISDPKRATDVDYRQAVADWHAARADLWAAAMEQELPDGGTGAILAWGDPSLYDSTLRILDLVAQRIDITYDVIPGITAIAALTARHRIPLNDIGEPVLITTGRRLRTDGLTGAAVVMLDGACTFMDCPPETSIWWGAYLGTADEMLIAGTVGAVGERIVRMRAEARSRHGWIMDTYLLRAHS